MLICFNKDFIILHIRFIIDKMKR